MKEKSLTDIADGLEKLNRTLERKSKSWNVFLSGILTGLGTAIGAVLIGAIVISIIASNLIKIPLIRNIIPEEVLEPYVGNDE